MRLTKSGTDTNRRAAAAVPGGEARSGSREKILGAAERLFADHGYEACSFRMISRDSGINQGLLHYHFGTKKNLFFEVFLRRARVLAEERMALLDQAEAETRGAAVPVETLVRCFVEPPLRMIQEGEGARAFVRIHSQLRNEPLAFGRELRRMAFDGPTLRYMAAMRKSCPHLSDEAVCWRFNFMIGTYLVVISQSGRLEDISRGKYSTQDIDAALSHIVPFIVAGFQSADTGAGKTQKKNTSRTMPTSGRRKKSNAKN